MGDEDPRRPRPFRFALQLTIADSGEKWLRMAQDAEEAGWDVVSMPDHLDEQFSPLIALASLCPVTHRVRLATFVLAVGWRRLGMLAKEVATLDVLSGGRLEIGLGAGWSAAEFAALGLPFGRASERIATLEAAIPVLKALWGGEEVSVDSVDGGIGVRCVPPPLQPGGPAIVLGGGGPRMLRVAGRLADIVSLVPSNAGRTSSWTLGGGLDRAAMAQQVAWVKEASSARPAPPEFNIRLLGVTAGPDPRRAARELAVARGYPAPDELVDSPYLLLGRPQDMAEQLEEARARFDVAYFTVSLMHASAMAEAMELVRS